MNQCILLSCLLFTTPLWAEPAFPIDTTPVDHTSGDSAILAEVTPAIVSIFPARLLEKDTESQDELMDRFFRRPPSDEEDSSDEPQEDFQGVGSGVILSADGLIVTNSHVVHLSTGKLADSITVETTDRRLYHAKILGFDRLTDLALLKIEATNLPSLSFLDSDQLLVGDKVFAVGNPFKIGLTATQGMVSALNRSGLKLAGEGSYEAFIQTDAPINPGNSGGALVDTRGRLVGINTAIYGGTGGNVGIGFAVPSNLVRHICTQLLADGKVNRGWLGIKVRELTSDKATEMDLKKISGVLVDATLAGAPASKAGIRLDDLILSVDGKDVRDRAAFRLAVSLHQPGEELSFKVMRGTEKAILELTAILTDQETIDSENAEFQVSSLSGVKLKTVKTDNYEGLEVISVSPNSSSSGKLLPGMIIIEINNHLITTFTSAETALRPGVNQIKIYHQERTKTLVLRLKS